MVRPIDITVFGGTGFLGRRIVECLVHNGLGVRIAVRHPDYVPLAGTLTDAVEIVRADIRSETDVRAAIKGARVAINAVSLYAEGDGLTFQAIHVDSARTLARAVAEAGLVSLVHMSGIGADAKARNRYIRSRGLGEAAVRETFDRAIVVRPSVMFGPGDTFLTALATVIRRLPVVPLFGKGEMRLQPVHVDDVAEAVALLAVEGGKTDTYELGGPQALAYADLLRLVMSLTGRSRKLVALPLPVWRVAAVLSRLLPRPPVTATQVALMSRDNVVSEGAAGFAALGIAPVSIADSAYEIFDAADEARARPAR